MYNTEEMALAAFAGAYVVLLVISLIASLFMVVCLWKIYSKAGKPGWGSIVPLYNTYLLFEIAMGNGWLFLLSLVPFVNIVIGIMVYFKLAGSFGKSAAYAFGLLFLPIIFFPMLAFGNTKYYGPQ